MPSWRASPNAARAQNAKWLSAAVVLSVVTDLVLSNNVVCPARFDEWLKGLCDPSPFSVTGNPDSDQQRIAQNVIQVYFFCVHYPGNK